MLFFFYINFFIYGLKLFSNCIFWFGWLTFDIKTLVLNVFLLIFSLKLISSLNSYQFLGYMFIWLITSAIYLFFMQLDVYACFLLVAESVVVLFVLSVFIHLNVNNLKFNFLIYKNYFIIFIPFLLTLYLNNYTATYFNYIVDWYNQQTSSFNDLLAQFIYLYNNGFVLMILALWLLVVTFIIVHVVLNIFSININKKFFKISKVFYVRKSQNMWKQWFTKPIFRFFK